VCRNRLRLLVLILMVLVNAALVAVAWRVITQRRAADSTDGMADAAEGGIASTALTAFALAGPAAAEWAGDAVLVRARGDWPEGSFSRQLASWVFVFYSAERGAKAEVTVVGRDVQVGTTSRTGTNLAPVAASEWAVDSDAIVETFLNGAGGTLFLEERSHVSMVLSLSLDGAARWTATLVDWETGELLKREFDAGNGYLVSGL
jgi:hypothetical protein